MKKEQRLYIDGILMDVGDDLEITLDIKSNLFRDVTKITSNNTYTINLPKTVHNMSATDWAAKPKNGSRYPYAFHKAQYFRNGLEIIKDGRATLMSIGDNIEISIYWGLFPALTSLQEGDMKLNELKTDARLVYNKNNEIDTYADAIKKGVFYGYYNAFISGEKQKSWSYGSVPQTKETSFSYPLVKGRIKTGVVGDKIGLTVEDAEGWYCAIAPIMTGYSASMGKSFGTDEYRTYAIVDKNNNVLEVGKVTDAPSLLIIEEAPVGAAKLIVNSKNEGCLAVSTNDILADWNYEPTVVGPTNDGNRVQPSVTCEHLIELIRQQTGVGFSWDSEATSFIRDLAVPLVTRKADNETFAGKLHASRFGISALGVCEFDISTVLDCFDIEQGERYSKLTVKADCKINLSCIAKWKWYAYDTTPSGHYQEYIDGQTVTIYTYRFYPPYIEIKITHKVQEGETEAQSPDTYIVGSSNSGDTMAEYRSDWMDKGYLSAIIYGAIDALELAEGDTITFELKCKDGFNKLTDFSLTSLRIKATYVASDEVPFGGSFPIGINLPEINVTDFIKFLALVTGTFPQQVDNASSVCFCQYSTMMNNRKNAVDWSKKLIPAALANIPRESNYSVENFCQHNRYKWKEDERTFGSYDADLCIKNEALDYEQDVLTLPFAASDGNTVPICEELMGTLKSNTVGDFTYTGGDYKGCKERIMNLLADSNGLATLSFDIDLQNIFDTKYSQLTKSLSKAHVITEWLNLTDLDILNFDETVPVYFAQYGAYFAVTELKTTSNGYTEATMLQLEF